MVGVLFLLRESEESYIAQGCANITVPVSIDENTGIGTALIPSEFLDTVFEEAHKRYMETRDDPWPETNVWHHSPGLYLNFYAVSGTMEYYEFE